jgi:hypothetical protein
MDNNLGRSLQFPVLFLVPRLHLPKKCNTGFRLISFHLRIIPLMLIYMYPPYLISQCIHPIPIVYRTVTLRMFSYFYYFFCLSNVDAPILELLPQLPSLNP